MSTTSASNSIRVARAEDAGLSAERMTEVLARAFELWRDRNFERRRVAIAEIARSAGFSLELMENSIDALIKPFTRDSLNAIASRISEKCKPNAPRRVGFIAAGNVAGAGIHEIAIALIAGAAVSIKTATAEPIFFREFARTITEIDRSAGARLQILQWGRERADLTAALIANNDLVVAYGDDATIETLHRPNVIGFGSRVSAAVIAPGDCGAEIDQVAKSLARDVVLFEQLGCLSPHQVFVLGVDGDASRAFALRMAAELEAVCKAMPPAVLPIGDAAQIRGLRERARWQAIAGAALEVFESRRLDWTLVYEGRPDLNEPFKISPGFRTLHVTAVRDLPELRDCLKGVSGRIEAMAVAGDESRKISAALAELKVPYVCAPGEMQSPPLDWAHGGGAFLDAILGAR
jgi:hypothetical protein